MHLFIHLFPDVMKYDCVYYTSTWVLIVNRFRSNVQTVGFALDDVELGMNIRPRYTCK